MEKDYSLLRPFDLEAAKAGEEICFYADGHSAKYFGESDQVKRDICVQWLETKHSVIEGKFAMLERDYFRMAPLCWVEGKPVYKGDVLYMKAPEPRTGDAVTAEFPQDDDTVSTFRSKNGAVPKIRHDQLTWTPPKVKREVKLFGYRALNGKIALGEDMYITPPLGVTRVESLDITIEVEE